MKKTVILMIAMVALVLMGCKSHKTVAEQESNVRSERLIVRDSVILKDSLIIREVVNQKDSVVMRDSVVIILNEAGEVVSREAWHDRQSWSDAKDELNKTKVKMDSLLNQRIEQQLDSSTVTRTVYVSKMTSGQKTVVWAGAIALAVLFIVVAFFVQKKVVAVIKRNSS